jgi:putative peptidoglycan lipid II flippase
MLTDLEPQPGSLEPEIVPPTTPSTAGRIARAALILMAGTILSRFLGLGREVVMADLFGAGKNVDAFVNASNVFTIVYDLLIAGTVNAALVPVFSEYAADEKRRGEFGRLVSTIMTIAALALLVSVAILELAAEPLVSFMGAGFSADTHALALEMTQWVLPGVIFMGLSGVVMSALYALGRFALPAFTSAVFNMAIITSGIVLAGVLGVRSLVLGMVAGAFAMLAMQLPGMSGVPLRPALDLNHPAVRKIFKLYAPIGLSVVVTSTVLVIDRNLASQTGEGSISAMRYATTLVQFALGMVSAAISIASLPSLSRHHARGDTEAYLRTLTTGLRLVIVMVLPAAAALLALREPLVGLIFRHGEFNISNQQSTALALLFYVPGLPFAAIDQVLIFAFYARKNTLTPVLVGIAQVVVYLAVALSTLKTMGMAGLVLAWSVQTIFHAVVTGALLWRALGKEGYGLRGYGLGSALLKTSGAAAVMGVVSYGAWLAISQIIHGSSVPTELILLGVPSAIGGLLYVVLIWAMKMPELQMVTGRVVSRLERFRRS